MKRMRLRRVWNISVRGFLKTNGWLLVQSVTSFIPRMLSISLTFRFSAEGHYASADYAQKEVKLRANMRG
jgi:hypothetical protein